MSDQGFAFLDAWHRFLPQEPGHVISLSGSGGKTSLMLALSGYYRSIGLPVLLTTTTRSESLPGTKPTQLAPDLQLPPDLEKPNFVFKGLTEDGKWLGLEPAQVDELSIVNRDKIVICECDGAAKMPLKLYLRDEPRWPDRTTLALVVMGTGSVGRFAEKVVHRLDREETWPRVGHLLETGRPVQWKDLEALLFGDGGYLDRVPDSVPAVLALSGLEDQDDSIGLFDFVGKVMANPRLPLVVFCHLGQDENSLRTAYRLEEGSW